MEDRPAPPPESALITEALKRRSIQAKRAAEDAGLSVSRWRQITTGYQRIEGQIVPVKKPPAETVARMARAVQVTPAELRDAGRPDAADELQLLLDGDTPLPSAHHSAAPLTLPDEAVLAPAELEIWRVQTMSPAERADAIATLRARRAVAELREENRTLRAELNTVRNQLRSLQR